MPVYRSAAPLFPYEKWSLPALLAHQAKENGARPFIRWTHEGPAHSFAESLSGISLLAASLRQAGIARGDRVVLYMNNSLMHVWCWLALNMIGAVDAPVNPAYFGALLARQIGLVRPRFIIVDAGLMERIEAVRADFDAERTMALLVNGEADAGSLADPIRSLGLAEATPAEFQPPDPREPASILLTSGTTGPAKGVRMPHAQTVFYSEQTVQLHRMTREDVYMAPYPLFHASARIHGVGSALVSGGECVLYDRFSASLFAERAALSRATITHFLGSMMTRIMEIPETGHDRASRLRSVMALPTPHRLAGHFRRRFRVENLCEVIGMTETSWTVMSPYGRPRPEGAAGLAVADWFDVRVGDPVTDLEVPVGSVGELMVRPRHPWIMFSEYENQPDRTVESFRNLWFHTGDLVRRDGEGWIGFVDRLKDSIRRGGENISSYEIEQALLAFPGIADAAVVAHRAASEELDEEIRAFLVPEDPQSFRLADLVAHLAGRLPRHYLPRYYEIVAELPLTPSGKVRKSVLREAPLTNDAIARPG
jgi:crotonobetaine/carnitine-CoA ligase